MLIVLVAASLQLPAPVDAAVRVGDLTLRPGSGPRRLAGYGLVVGLDGTGDRSFGRSSASTPTVRSVVNLLRRFNVEVPPEQLRARNVAAVLVTAEVSPYLRSGGRFEVQVAALGDAGSLRGGMLWITPLVTDPGEPPVATAQGALLVDTDPDGGRSAAWSGNAARIPQGGLLETDAPIAPSQPKLLLREPDLATAGRIAGAINAAFGAGAAKLEDPGSIALTPPRATGGTRDAAADLMTFLAAVDTLRVTPPQAARVVIDRRAGTVVAGGDLDVGPAMVSHGGITLEIGEIPVPNTPEGLVRVGPGATVQDVAAGLHAAGARGEDVAAVFEALRAAGAIRAELVLR